ncbi:hypothetical protein SDC9_170055 [bioreactor metagenome]|uniref:Uncharacterized protein n=1 Tax=bioreactor metagenome TaxID=1076179 RepID=A0A645G9L8_9ZZZZ
MVIVAGVEQLEVAAVKIDPVLMGVVWVFPGLFCIGSEIDYLLDRIYCDHFFYMVFAGGDPVYQFALVVIKVQMCPATPFGPPDKVVAGKFYRTCLYVCIEPLLNKGFECVGCQVGYTKVDPLEIAAGAGYIKTVVVALPHHMADIVGHIFLEDWFHVDAQLLVFESIGLDFTSLLALHIKHIEMSGGGLCLTGHVIFVPLQFRP